MNKEVIGQEEAKREIDKTIKIFKQSQCKIRPHSIVTGSSGSGKSHTIQTLAKLNDLNFIEINAASITKEGTSGNSLSKALTPLSQSGGRPTICFVDEFDKLFISGNSNSDLAHESTNGVQNEFLKVLESDTASVFGDYGKYIETPVSNVLFIFAGAFNGEEDIDLDRLRELGIKTEFLGRVSLVYNLKPLTIESLFKILETSELLENYISLFHDADKETVIYDIKAHLQKVFEMNTLGARVVNTLIHQYFINGGLKEKEVEKITFQKKLSLKD
tara:strand:- start:1 stop:822 length:822 start_codon:yes stop_codon:yes gene_type:complete